MSVTELTGALNQALTASFPEVLFEGEISQAQQARSGHFYFVIKDSTSQLSAVMWSSAFARLDFPVEPGLSVQCHGKPNVYSGSGKLQIVVHRMFPSGEGALRKKFLEMKAKLELEGFFAEHRKRRLPFLPRAVGIVTSKTGAVIHDIMVRFRERMPCLPVYLVDVKVQGEGAAAEIAAGIRQLDKSKLVDVIIVARGGGSLDDLWAFNEEAVVKAIFACSVPVISGVGHEVDISLSDLVADVRAPTPTAAAEIVVPRRDDLLARLAEFERRLGDTDRWLKPLAQRIDELSLRLDNRIAAFLQQGKLQLAAAAARLRGIEPRQLIRTLDGKVDNLSQRLFAAAERRLQLARRSVDAAAASLDCALPLQQVSALQSRLEALSKRLDTGVTTANRSRLAELERLSSKLEAINPRRVMQRGFSIVELRGKIVRSTEDVAVGDELRLLFARGEAAAKVSRTKE
jgi:exodeoxyribonuclease VII large subunit